MSIERTPGVMGGAPCVGRPRIPVWVLEQFRRLGMSEAELLRSYPQLTAADLAEAWAFVGAHEAEITAQIEEHNGPCELNAACDLQSEM